MVMSPVMALFTFMVLLTLSSAVSETTTKPQLDIGLESKRLVSLTRKLTSQAKEGTSLDMLVTNVLNLQTKASVLLGQIPEQISECQTQAVIKMAAAGIGSHEVLGLLLAEDPIAVLSRRLELSLAFLEHVAQQVEDELTLSRDVAPYLAALVFGTSTSVLIIQNSEQAVTDTYTRLKNNDVTVEKGVTLGTGFSSGQNGAHWKSTVGSHYFQITPARPRAARQARLNLNANPDGYSVSGQYAGAKTLGDGTKVTGRLTGQANFDRGFDYQGGQVGGTVGLERKLGNMGDARVGLSAGATVDRGGDISGWNAGVDLRLTF